MNNTFNLMASAALICGLSTSAFIVSGSASTDDWVRTFDLDQCTMSPVGSNDYFFLVPGYQLILDGQDDGDRLQLVLTVLDQTRTVDGIETRVVEERETENGELVEVSTNYLAICTETKDIYYFGEEVDMYSDGEIESHEGAWLAGEDGATAGLLYPANPKVGMKFYQEIALGIAEDRAEIISLDEQLKVPAGNFSQVLKVEETTPLEPREKEFKYYARGVGLLQDQELKLTKYTIPEPSEEPPSPLNSQPQTVIFNENSIRVEINSSSTISNFALDEMRKSISFNASGAAGEGMTEIYIGTILEGPYTVSVDGEVLEDVEVIQLEESGMSMIRIAQVQNSSVVTITGTNVVPEFPAAWILAVVATVGIAAVVVRFNRSEIGLN
jgi:hypothetical protein